MSPILVWCFWKSFPFPKIPSQFLDTNLCKQYALGFQLKSHPMPHIVHELLKFTKLREDTVH